MANDALFVRLPLPPSLWAATARPAPATPRLDASCQADVAIVGAGYSGLAAALRLREAGASVVVLEAGEPGWGASGRNGGQVIPGLKWDPDELVAMFGAEAGEHLAQVAGGAPATLFDLIDTARASIARRSAAAGSSPASPMPIARSPSGASRNGRSAAPTSRCSSPTRCARSSAARSTSGGWIDRRAGSVQPLSYARGLARAAQARRRHRVRRFARHRAGARRRRAGPSPPRTAPVVSAGQVLLATNGYTDGLWPQLRQTVIAANSFQVATEPLPEALRSTVLPQGQVASDTRKLLLYYRANHDGRLIMGGRGTFREPDGAGRFQPSRSR